MVGVHAFSTVALAWKGRHFRPQEFVNRGKGVPSRGLVVGVRAFGTAALAWKRRHFRPQELANRGRGVL